MNKAKPIATVAFLGAVAWFYYPKPATPEQAARQALLDERERIAATIQRRESYLATDRQHEDRAQLDSFRSQHRGKEAAAEGKRLRAQAERLREDNIHQINKLRADLAELELKIRGLP